MLHELIHAVSMAYISAHWNRPTPALVRFTKVFDEVPFSPRKAFDAYSKTLDADELALLKSALRATAGMNETNRFAAVSEFLTYGLTHLPFQEYLQNLRVDESKLPREMAAGSTTSVSAVKDAEGKTSLTKREPRGTALRLPYSVDSFRHYPTSLPGSRGRTARIRRCPTSSRRARNSCRSASGYGCDACGHRQATESRRN